MRVGRSTFPTRIYDDGGKSYDRYTLVVPSVNEPGNLDMYGFNEDPYFPTGFGQFAGSYWPMGSYSHLGKLISLSDLPDQAQRYVRDILETSLPDGYGLDTTKLRGLHRGKSKKKWSQAKKGTATLRGLRR